MDAAATSAPATHRVTWYSVAMAAGLALAKAAIWIASGSVALLASTADSLLDLIASGATFYAVRYAAAPPDAEHRFGHGKAEAFASLLQAGLVFASAALVVEEAVGRLLRPAPVRAQALALGVMVASTLLTGLLIAAQTAALRRARSVAVASDRTHYLADLVSNFVALAGIAAAVASGVAAFDAIAGLIVTAILIWGAISVFRRASGQLMDHELPRRERARIRELMMADSAILDVHQLRTRASGPNVHIQMHADLDPALSLEAAHKIVVAAERRVLAEFPEADILIHPDPRGRAEPHGGAFAEQTHR
ncbi:MAG TPA: cation diffusion facilitator family transporter [Caulobacteraceae bacterium]|nr:cation diffusion facilitator family transporter [Caulobacteraceae bacterium]